MSSRMYGYARVSTRAQKEDRQLAALTEFLSWNILTIWIFSKEVTRLCGKPSIVPRQNNRYR